MRPAAIPHRAGALAAGLLLALGLAATPLAPAVAEGLPALQETPYFADKVAAGAMPPIGIRLPEQPSVVHFSGDRTIGRSGGVLKTLIARPKDVRLLVVYGYARLVAYDDAFELVPDIAERVEIEDDRVFTFHLRKGHRWSDGHPFTAEDFRYWWEDVANNPELSPAGPPRVMMVDDEPARFEVIDETTVRFSWSKPNTRFLPRIAGASPLFVYRPAHYLKQYHENYADPGKLKRALRRARTRNWAALHNRLDNLYRFDNPKQPTLQPWVNRSRPPATRFVAERNPYYHRIDSEGRQLPYIDKVYLLVSDPKLIAAKAGTGEIDLQARNLAFSNFRFLKENEAEYDFDTYLWNIAKGAHIALFPNLNVADPEWRELMRNVDFRRALSLSIDRSLINESLYFGLAIEGNNTVLPSSPLFKQAFQTYWAAYDPEQAEAILDNLGLNQFNDEDVRLLPSGRPLEIIVETAGEDTEQIDVLELIRENWAEIGVKLYIKPSQREVFRNRVFSGEAQMSVWSGLENGVPTAQMSPQELAPTSQQQLHWPKWGQYYETSGKAGVAHDLPEVIELDRLLRQWRAARNNEERSRIWQEMLEIHAQNVFTIGVISGVKQPVVVKRGLRNVPREGVYNWDPGAHFGIYRPDTFWLDR